MTLTELKWDAAGLVTVVVQDRHTGEIRMLAHADATALRATLQTGQAHFYSRSRQSLWRKGETSGHTLAVAEVWTDCDGDAVVYLVDPNGPTCHTGRRTCFFRRLRDETVEEASFEAAPTLLRLEGTLDARKASTGEKSYTRSLLDGGPPKIGAKLREEADELARAIADEPDANVAAEAADVVYHLLVGLISRGVPLRDVEEVLARRFGRSGHEEKASRS